MKRSKLHNYIIKMIHGEDIEEFDLGTSAKYVLHKIKEIVEKDENNDFVEKLKKAEKMNISIAKRMLLQKQEEEQLEKLKNDTVDNTKDK